MRFEDLRQKINFGQEDNLKHLYNSHAILVESTDDLNNMLDEFHNSYQETSNYGDLYVVKSGEAATHEVMKNSEEVVPRQVSNLEVAT